MEFRTDPVFEALRSPLGLVDDPERRQALERYVEAARLPLERAVFDLLAGLTESVNEKVGSQYRLRLAYRAGALDLEVEEQDPGERLAAMEAEWQTSDGGMEKVTIRIPAELKELVTQAAAGAGTSVNTWFIRVLAGALRASLRAAAEPERGRHGPHGPHGGHMERRTGRGARLSGWIGDQ